MEHKTNIVTYELEASAFQWEIAPGKTVNAWGFNNQIPGPVLKAKKGDTMVIRVTNNLDESTLVHWHGIRLPAAMDGTGEVQKPIQPGEVFEYRFVVPDAGSFWYHSHANETEQMEKGMYGALIVEDDNDPVMDDDRVFMIDDMKLTSKNEYTKPGWALPRLVERHDGREGNTALLNGKENPTINIHAGQKERWRFINSSSARYIMLYLGGREFTIMGTDGGLLEKPETATQVLLTPGERVDIIAGPFSEEETFFI
ncbi:MAG TPA: multicopper oxidase domain-containing protein, partial [Flavisolibacter sp.]|nr:multicopper oxidase domain-containing protein [Flavisolibacter sp.]